MILEHPVTSLGSVLGILSILALLKYRGAIQRQLEILKTESWLFGAGVTMERCDDDVDETNTSNRLFEELQLLQLSDEFADTYQQQGWKLTTLGEYLSSLRPKGMIWKAVDTPQMIQREIEAGLAAGLLKALGPNLGRALLPAVGSGFVQKRAQSVASTIAAKWILNNKESDKAGIPVPFMTLLSIADTNAKLNANETLAEQDTKLPDVNLTAMTKMERGEVVKGPSFCENDIPNHFVISLDFDKTVRKMEQRLVQGDDYGGLASTELKMAKETVLDQETVDSNTEELRSESYDPDDLRLGEPVPVNPRLFPDLHIGYGDAKSSHTKREVLKMRLLSILLNKLGANYYKQVNGAADDLFTVQLSDEDKPISTPSEFVQALLDTGHEIEAVPSSRLTTFGIGMCIKEKDGSYTNVPLGVFLESGYEDKDGRMAPAMLPHSGLDLRIRGPLAGSRTDGTPSTLALQHFIGIEGFCGWHSHANPVVPFNEAVPAGAPLRGENAVRAVRLAGLHAIVLNGLASELGLPFGGYGTTAVCNDSAAIIQQCLYGETTIYPLTSIGRFAQRTIRYAKNFRNELAKHDGFDVEVQDLDALVQAMKQLPSDINASPSCANSAAKRMLHTLQPKLPFRLMHDAKSVMESIIEEEEKIKDTRTPTETKNRERKAALMSQ
jgi:hypothetical protein